MGRGSSKSAIADLLLRLQYRFVHLLIVAVPALNRCVLAGQVIPQPRLHHEHELSDGFLLGEHFGQGSLAVVHGVAPALHEEQQPQLTRRDLLQHLPDGQEVLQALAHLAAFDVQMPRVQKVVHPPAPHDQMRTRPRAEHALMVVPVRLCLSHLVVVVRELEVDAAAVHVQGGAQQL